MSFLFVIYLLYDFFFNKSDQMSVVLASNLLLRLHDFYQILFKKKETVIII